MIRDHNVLSKYTRSGSVFLRAGATLSVILFVTPSFGASLSDEILNAPASEVLHIASQVAEAMATETPMQIDKTTKLIGAQFLKSNKTFYYQYQTTISLNSKAMRPYVINKTCSDDIRRSFLKRGVTIRHQYEMPSGEVVLTISINHNSCQNHY